MTTLNPSLGLALQASQTYGGRVVEWPVGGTGVHCRHSKPRCKELPRLATQTVGHPGRCLSTVWLQNWGLGSSSLPTVLIHLLVCWCAVSVFVLVIIWFELCRATNESVRDYMNMFVANICFVFNFRSTNCGTVSWSLWRIFWKKMWGTIQHGTRGIL